MKTFQKNIRRINRYRKFGLFGLAALFFIVGCTPQNLLRSDGNSESEPKSESESESIDAGKIELSALNKQLMEEKLLSNTLKRELLKNNTRVAKLQLQMMEKDAIIQQLRTDQRSQGKRLDDSIQEIVRTKAKLQSRISKAETVANMAEVIIALKQLKTRIEISKESTEIKRAELLIDMSRQEFKLDNHGGAYYLASEAKKIIAQIQSRADRAKDFNLRETQFSFATPLPFRVRTRSNIRSTPTTKGKILRTVNAQTEVDALAYKNFWIHVRLKDNMEGWIHHTLLGVENQAISD